MRYKSITYVGDFVIRRSYDTEVRICGCADQRCRGRFLVRKSSTQKVCPHEATRLMLVWDLRDYYR